MRILQVTPRVPTPPTDGGRLAMRNLAAGLRRAGADVERLSLNPRKHRVDPASAGCETFDIDTGKLLPAFLRSLRSGIPPNVARFVSDGLAGRLAMRAREFDVVQLEELATAPYVDVVRRASSARVVLRPLNVESEVWQRLAESGPPLARAARRLLATWLRAYERRVVPRCDALVPVTEGDGEALGRHASVPVHVAPVGIDCRDYAWGAAESEEICFLGSLDYEPNVEGLTWLLGRVWPELRGAGLVLRVAGSGASEATASRVRESGAEYVGLVPDAKEFMARHGTVVVPLLSGGGMRVKIVEAMALGRAVVTTAIGAEGLNVRDRAEVRLADEPSEFASAIRELAVDRDARVAIGARARRLVEETLDETVIGRGLVAFYERLVSRREVL
jgi:polysaccharide biosynthesis protein PslH